MWRFVLALSLVACQDKPEDTDKGRNPAPQDTDDPLVEDVFVQALRSSVDILWLVDPGWDEGMDGLEEAIQDGYETLLVSGADWRLGVLNATIEQGMPGYGLIGPKYETYPPPPNVFNYPPADEPPKVRDALYAALELRREHEANSEFLRSDAELYVIVYTNKEDESFDAELTRLEWRDWFRALQPSEATHLGAIVGEGVRGYWDNQIIGDGTVTVADSFKKAIQTRLREAVGQRTVFELSHVPTAPIEEVSVVYREMKQIFEDKDYQFSSSGNTIIFKDYVPPDGAEIHVRYMGGAEIAATIDEG